MSKKVKGMHQSQEMGNSEIEGINADTYKEYKDIINEICKSEKLREALIIAAWSHDGQARKSGEQYICHPLEVYRSIRDKWGVVNDMDLLAAALMHDVLEDTKDEKKEELKKRIGGFKDKFKGSEAFDLVEGVTKLKSKTDIEILKEFAKKAVLDIRVVLLKLADRGHNQRTLDAMPRDKQIEKSEETMAVYVRLAEYLGLWVVKTELEDLCFQYLYPDEFAAIKSQIDADPRRDEDYIAQVQNDLKNVTGYDVEVKRAGYWASYQKRRRLAMDGLASKNDFADIKDLVSFRVIVPDSDSHEASVDSCMDILKILRKPYAIKKVDLYVDENKRPNGYEAIHTTAKLSRGLVEIAIATNTMEDYNNWGIVSKIRNGIKDLECEIGIHFTPSGSVRLSSQEITAADFAGIVNTWLLFHANSVLIDGKRAELTDFVANASTV